MEKDIEIPNPPVCKNPNCTELADMRRIPWEGFCSYGCMRESANMSVRLKEENKKLREALKFYATNNCDDCLVTDEGDIARQALEDK